MPLRLMPEPARGDLVGFVGGHQPVEQTILHLRFNRTQLGFAREVHVFAGIRLQIKKPGVALGVIVEFPSRGADHLGVRMANAIHAAILLERQFQVSTGDDFRNDVFAEHHVVRNVRAVPVHDQRREAASLAGARLRQSDELEKRGQQIDTLDQFVMTGRFHPAGPRDHERHAHG